LTEAIKGFDVVITTALVPGRPAPTLYSDRTAMLFGDAKASVSEITEELKVL
jgi:NAD/NADP transhydrogenase alpha subunit